MCVRVQQLEKLRPEARFLWQHYHLCPQLLLYSVTLLHTSAQTHGHTQSKPTIYSLPLSLPAWFETQGHRVVDVASRVLWGRVLSAARGFSIHCHSLSKATVTKTQPSAVRTQRSFVAGEFNLCAWMCGRECVYVCARACMCVFVHLCVCSSLSVSENEHWQIQVRALWGTGFKTEIPLCE